MQNPEIRLVSVECNHCGAPLEVGENTNFVTCSHCGSKLAVVKTDSARFTEVVSEVSKKLAAIEVQNDIEQLDREFQMEKQDHMIETKHGRSAPSIIGGVVAILAGGGFGIFWTIQASSMGAPGFFPLFGVVVTLLIVGSGIASIIKAMSLSDAEDEYRRKRREKLEELNRVRGRVGR